MKNFGHVLDDHTVNDMMDIIQTKMGRDVEDARDLVRTFEMLLELPNPDTGNSYDNNSFDLDAADEINDFFRRRREPSWDRNYVKNPPSNERENLLFEAFLKKIIMLVMPDIWQLKWDNYKNDLAAGTISPGKMPFMLSDSLKTIGVIDRAKEYKPGHIDLNAENPDDYSDYPDFLNEFIRTYKGRNAGAHSENYSNVYGLYIAFFDTVDRCRERFDYKGNHYYGIKYLYARYCADEMLSAERRKFVESYEASGKDKTYTIVNWTNTKTEESVTTEELDTKLNSGVLKIIGGPGVGKTAAMEYCMYRACKDYKYGNGRIKLPMYVRCEDINLTKKSIRESLLEKYELTDVILELMLSQGAVSLYIDGYNELIGDGDGSSAVIKKDIALEIDNTLCKKYKNLHMVISDRLEKSKPPICNNATAIELTPLDEIQIVDFLIKNCSATCSDPEDAERVLGYYTDGEKLNDTGLWLADNERVTPHFLESMVEFSRDKYEVADERRFWMEYLAYKMERELSLKKDTRIDNLKFLMTKVANATQSEETVSKTMLMDLMMEIGKINENTAKGYIELLKEMDIYIYEDGTYKFAKDEYKYYFLNEMWEF